MFISGAVVAGDADGLQKLMSVIYRIFRRHVGPTEVGCRAAPRERAIDAKSPTIEAEYDCGR